MAVTPAERRRFQRVAFNAKTVLSQNEQIWSTHLLDLSLKGLLVKTPEGFAAALNESFMASVELNEQTELQMKVTLSHQSAETLGLECVHIDIDSITHLRRLLELNLGDAALLERELKALGEPIQTTHQAPAQDA